jgi:hypothetical protein
MEFSFPLRIFDAQDWTGFGGEVQEKTLSQLREDCVFRVRTKACAFWSPASCDISIQSEVRHAERV